MIEDSTFDFVEDGDGALDAYVGAKFVFRHPTFLNTHVAWRIGNAMRPGPVGQRELEDAMP